MTAFFERSSAIVLRQLYLLRGSWTRVLPIFCWVVIDIVLWGYLSRYLDSIVPNGHFLPVLLGAVLLWDFFGRVAHGISTAFLEDVWSRNFLNTFASPLTVGEYLAGLVATGMLTSLMGLIIMLVLATAVFGTTFLQLGLALIPFVLVLFLFGVALGVLGCAMILRLGPASEWLIWPLPGLLSPFVGVFYPLNTLPGWMQALGKLLPPSYVFESMRTLLAGGALPAGQLAVAWGLAIADVVLAGLVFARVFRAVVRTGLIARYSAETLA